MWVVAVAGVMLVAVLLLVPVDVAIDVGVHAGQQQPAVRGRVRWLMLTWRIDKPGTGLGRPSAPRAPRRVRRRRHKFNALAAVRSPGLLYACGRLLRRLARLMRPGDLHVRGRIGFDDPADTAMCAAWIYSLRGVGVPPRAVAIEPEFSGPIIEGEAHVHWSRNLASLLAPCLAFVSAPAFWRAVRAGWR